MECPAVGKDCAVSCGDGRRGEWCERRGEARRDGVEREGRRSPVGATYGEVREVYVELGP